MRQWEQYTIAIEMFQEQKTILEVSRDEAIRQERGREAFAPMNVSNGERSDIWLTAAGSGGQIPPLFARICTKER